MKGYIWEEFYTQQSSTYLQERAKQVKEFLGCLQVMYSEGVIEEEGLLLLSNQAKAKLGIMEKILASRSVK